MRIDETSTTPVYQQLVDSFNKEIRAGRLPAGSKLPTVRALAQKLGISKGTVKHAYDTMEQLGLIKKTQGRGSFVCGEEPQHAQSKKEQALAAIDHMLDTMDGLGFSLHDTRIFWDLKMRERENARRSLRIGAVDCSPEALSVICDQVSDFPFADAYDFLLEDVLGRQGLFDPSMDILITTPTHYEQLRGRLAPGLTLLQMVLSVAPHTISSLSQVAAGARVGILCGSRRFAHVISKTCRQFCTAKAAPRVVLFGSAEATGALLKEADVLILPPNHLRFCTPAERELLAKPGCRYDTIQYQYQVERGSLLYLQEEMERLQAKGR